MDFKPKPPSKPEDSPQVPAQPEQPTDSVHETAIRELNGKLHEIIRLRKTQSIVSCCGAVLILLILVQLLFNLYHFGINFDHAQFAAEALERGTLLLRSAEIKTLENDFNTVFIPTFQARFSEQLQEETPKIKHLIKKESDKLISYAESDIKQLITRSLRESFEKLEADLVKKHGGNAISSEDLAASLKGFDAVLVRDITAVLDKNTIKAKQSLGALYATTESFKQLPEYQEIRSVPPAQAESRLIETFLELWIYHLNPERSKTNASGGKGI